jgi:hypothetical protein
VRSARLAVWDGVEMECVNTSSVMMDYGNFYVTYPIKSLPMFPNCREGFGVM